MTERLEQLPAAAGPHHQPQHGPPLGLEKLQGQFSFDVPAMMAGVLLSTLPLVVLFIFMRRQVMSGLGASSRDERAVAGRPGAVAASRRRRPRETMGQD